MRATARRSPPPPPPPPNSPVKHSGPAHRHLALLRTADWRQSAATPVPHADGEAEKQGAPTPRDGGCVHDFFSPSK